MREEFLVFPDLTHKTEGQIEGLTFAELGLEYSLPIGTALWPQRYEFHSEKAPKYTSYKLSEPKGIQTLRTKRDTTYADLKGTTGANLKGYNFDI